MRNVESTVAMPKARHPEGWQIVTLGDVCDFLDSRRVPVNNAERERRIAGKPKADLYPYYGANGQVGWIDDYIFEEPLILLAEDGGPFGSTDKAIAYPVQGRCWVNNHAHVLRPRQGVDFDFCALTLSIRPDVGALVTGSTRPKLNQETAAKILIPLPPLAIQRHIAEQLKAQLAEVDRVRTALHAQVEAAKVLPAASLRAVFGDAAHEPSLPKGLDWRPVRLGQVCEIIARQVDPKLPEYSSLPHVNGENIESGTCRLTRVRSAAEDGMTSGKYLFEAGDVLYSKLRPYLRKVALVDFRGLCSADMYPLRPNNTWLDSDYMAWMLVSDGFTRYATQESQRARMPKINREELFAWTFSLPPLPTQRALAARLRTEVAEATELCRALETKLATLDRLPAALLRQVFGGADGFTDAAYLRQ